MTVPIGEAVVMWSRRPGESALATLARMVDLTRAEYRDRRVVETAEKIAVTVPAKQTGAIARALLAWLRAHTHYVPDPDGMNDLKTPTYMLTEIATNGVAPGDCDDVAMLAAAMCKAIGLGVTFVAEAYQGDPKTAPLVHVYAVADTDVGGVALDTQLPPDTIRYCIRRVTLDV